MGILHFFPFIILALVILLILALGYVKAPPDIAYIISGLRPVITAVLPSVFMSAPILASSSTWRKRLEKIVSVTTLVPLALQSIAITGACASVGKPDKAASLCF